MKTLLHTTHRYDHFTFAGNQECRINDPVLFGAHEFLPFDDQDLLFSLVKQPQLRNTTSLIHLGDLDNTPVQGLFECQVIRPGYLGCQQGKQGQIFIGLFAGQFCGF